MNLPRQPGCLPLAPAVPLDRRAGAYAYFGSTFEALEYSDWITESMSWKTTAYIGDWSPLAKIEVSGPDALRLFSDLGINGFGKFAIGQAKHVAMCNHEGKLAGDGILMRLDEDVYKYTGGVVVAWVEFHFLRGGYSASLRHVGPEQFMFQVQGPSALEIVEAVTGESLRDIGFMRFRPVRIGGVDLLALRQGMAGEIGFELHGPIEHGPAIYQQILDAGQRYGIKRLGGRTKMVNHVEACFPTQTIDFFPAFEEPTGEFLPWFEQAAPNLMKPAAASFLSRGSYPVKTRADLYRSPFELGWGKNIRFDHDFIGRAALEREASAPPRTIVTLVWNSEDVIDIYASLFRKGVEPGQYMEMPRDLGVVWADQVLAGDSLIGCALSRCYSVYFREMISLCVIDVEHAAPGTEVTVLWGEKEGAQKRIRATVAPAPYKRDNRRADLSALPDNRV